MGAISILRIALYCPVNENSQLHGCEYNHE